jgi:hypothetical protein
MPIRGADEPRATDPPHAVPSASCEARLPLNIGDSDRDCSLVRFDERAGEFLATDRHQDADALRRREGQVKRSHPTPTMRRTKRIARARIAAVHHRHERIALDLACHPRPAAAAADPSAGRFASRGVVVLDPGGHLALVVFKLVALRAELADAQHGAHRPKSPTAPASLMHVVCGLLPGE